MPKVDSKSRATWGLISARPDVPESIFAPPDFLVLTAHLRNDADYCHAPRTMREWPSTFSVANTYPEAMGRA
jgi:hypothetical protein